MRFAAVQAHLNRLMVGGKRLKILEAGCGSASRLDFGTNPEVTGIDISARQLDRNHTLSRKIHGDLQTEALGEGYDAAVCWDVLEHLDRPDLALTNIFGAIRAGGLVVLAAPDPWSPKGLLTKLTPLWFHVWVYRLAGKEWAGTADRGPFPTPMRLSMSPARIERIGRAHEFELVHREGRESKMQRSLRRRIGLSGCPWTTIRRLVNVVTFGRMDIGVTDFVIVLRAPGQPLS